MAISGQSQPPSPLKFFAAMNAFHLTAALKTAIELDLFTAIAEHNSTAAAIAKHVQAAERGIRILCDFLVVHEILTKSAQNYALTQDSAVFLNRKSPAYLGSAIGFLTAPDMRNGYDRLTDAVRRGGTALPGEGTVEPDNPIWVEFARDMAPLMTLPAEAIARALGQVPAPRKVLDIAAGHGRYGITLAQRFPAAHVVALDWRNVLEVAKENAEKAGVSNRYSTIAGSAFDADFGSGYDVVLLTNFLHHFDVPTCTALLRKVHAALAPGGRAATVEFVPNDDRVSPPPAATFSLIMLAGTRAGDAYTFRELDQMFRAAGFQHTDQHAADPSPFTVLISTK